MIACTDGIQSGAEALEAAFLKAKLQLCILHQTKGSMRYVASKDKKEVANALKTICRSTTAQAAEQALGQFAKTWDHKYPSIARQWRGNWPRIATMFDCPDEIRKIIYTANAIESLNSVIRKATHHRTIFPSDQSALKPVYLAIMQASAKRTKAAGALAPGDEPFCYRVRYKMEWMRGLRYGSYTE